MSTSSAFGTATAAYWFQFFLDAGIPPADAGNYAVTFTENRIQQDMIVDLTKEYLSEMGVTVLGDMIAILKHAKRVHTEATREKVLKGSGFSSVNVEGRSSTNLLNQTEMAGKSSMAARVSVPIRPSRPVAEPNVEQFSVSKLSQSLPTKTATASAMLQEKQVSSNKKPESQKVNTALAAKTVKSPAKRKAEQSVAQTANAGTVPTKGTVVRLKPQIVHEVPVPTSRSVSQEHEGGYKIIFPSGVTKKTNNATSQKDKTGVKQSSVFDRLGEECSETKSLNSSSAVGPSPPEETSKKSTVFCRLGEQRLLKRVGTENDEEIVVTKKAKTTIEGRLGPQKTNLVTPSSSSAGILSCSTKSTSRPVHLRLGSKSLPVQNDGQDTSASVVRIASQNREANAIKLKSSDSNVAKFSGLKKITLSADKGVKRKLKDDLVIHVEPQGSGRPAAKETRQVAGQESQKSNSVLLRLGPQKSKTQTVPSALKKSGNVMLRLGPQKPGAKTVQSKSQIHPDNVSITVLVGSSKPNAVNSEETRTLKQVQVTRTAVSTGIFSRLGNMTS